MRREFWVLLTSLFASGNLILIYWNIRDFYRYTELQTMFTWMPFSLFIHLWIDFTALTCLLFWVLGVKER